MSRFQWAALQIDQVIFLERERDIRECLGQLPEDLTTTYNEIYAQIKTAEGSKSEIAIRALQWVMCACRLLDTELLVAAVCQDPEDEKTQAVDIGVDIEFVLDACRNLLVIDTQLDVCRLSHLSVQEYFEEHHWNTSQTNGTVAKVCLSLLNDRGNWNRGFGNKDTKQFDPLTKLLSYARKFWPIHVRDHEDG